MALSTYTTPAPFTIAPDENCYSALVANATARPDTVLFTKPEDHRGGMSLRLSSSRRSAR